MSKRRKKREGQSRNREEAVRADYSGPWSGLQKETRGSIIGLVLVIVALILLLAAGGESGYLGEKIYLVAHFFFGVGYYVIPVLFILLSINFFRAGGHNLTVPALSAGPFFVLSALGLLALIDRTNGTGGLGGWGG